MYNIKDNVSINSLKSTDDYNKEIDKVIEFTRRKMNKEDDLRWELGRLDFSDLVSCFGRDNIHKYSNYDDMEAEIQLDTRNPTRDMVSYLLAKNKIYRDIHDRYKENNSKN